MAKKIPDNQASRPDEDNPEWTKEDFARARPAAEVLPEFIGEKATQELMQENAGKCEVELYGKKGREFFKRRQVASSGDKIGVSEAPKLTDARELSVKLMGRFTREEVDSVYLIFNEFKSVLSQKVSVKKLLPLTLSEERGSTPPDYIYEQPPAVMLDALLPQFVENEIYQAMLESAASEHAARMTAMDAATSNATEVIDKLTLHMNRVRQASITREIIEVVSGAAALE